jgi:signal transduction histidine kinase
VNSSQQDGCQTAKVRSTTYRHGPSRGRRRPPADQWIWVVSRSAFSMGPARSRQETDDSGGQTASGLSLLAAFAAVDWSPAQSREFLDILHEEIDRLDASVSEVFWTAYIDAGKLAPSRDLHDIGSLVSSALREIQPELRARSVRVAMSDPPAQATFDRAMIKGVLKELLRNALKYSPEGSPLAVSVRQCEQDFTITVTDEGIGVPAEEQDRIFEKHYRGNVKARGSGLGLSIAKTIIEAHGGTIGVTSGPNRGASFHVTLPNGRQKVA